MSYLGQVELKSSDIRRVDVTSSTSATHTLTWIPPSEQSLIVTINGVKQQNNYTISGTTLTLDSALIASDELEVVGILDIGTTNIPADDSITNAMVKSSAAIATSKISGAVTSIASNGLAASATTDTTVASNISSGTLGTARMGSGSATSSTVLHGNNTWAEVSGGTSWQAVQTTGFTAVAGNGYPVNTTGAEITVTLPASASAGDTIEFVDYAATFDEYNAILDPQSLKINGDTADRRLLALRQGVRIVYVDATQGWLAVTAANVVIDDKALSPFYSATGGTITTYSSGGVSYRVHTFTSSGNFVSNNVGTVDAIVVGGGGGGKSYGGGGGGGSVIHLQSKPVTASTYAIVLAAGGAGSASDTTVTSANDGGTTTFAGYSATGGGGGGGYNDKAARTGANSGGSGPYILTSPGAGTAPSDTDAYDTIYGGNTGGAFVNGTNYPSGGGSGAGANGGTPASAAANGGNGGAGVQINIDGNDYYWGGGGAGSVYTYTSGNGGNGGIGGGGGGADGGTGGAGINNGGSPAAGVNAVGGVGGTNTGGGGGGGNHVGGPFNGGAGGSGIVIVRYII